MPTSTSSPNASRATDANAHAANGVRPTTDGSAKEKDASTQAKEEKRKTWTRGRSFFGGKERGDFSVRAPTATATAAATAAASASSSSVVSPSPATSASPSAVNVNANGRMVGKANGETAKVANGKPPLVKNASSPNANASPSANGTAGKAHYATMRVRAQEAAAAGAGEVKGTVGRGGGKGASSPDLREFDLKGGKRRGKGKWWA
ncbi:hypothetical protein B0H16DRAFT_1502518, partial [Mycena metata]